MEPIMHEPGRHGWAGLLRLVGAVRRLAFDRNLPPSEALGRIRDAFHDFDQQARIGRAVLSPAFQPTFHTVGASHSNG